MGLFDKVFGGKKQEIPAKQINEVIATMEQYLRVITTHYGETHFQGDTQAKQILSVYAFGGVSALAIQLNSVHR